jgi:hypothetical protein
MLIAVAVSVLALWKSCLASRTIHQSLDQPQATPVGGASGEFWKRSTIKEEIDLWYKYESIAMHFNDLLMKLRMQALAGLAAVVTIFCLYSDKIAADFREKAGLAVGVVLSMAWLAIGAVDFLYYQKLLIGAVDAIEELEKATQGAIRLSTRIEQNFPRRCPRIGPWVFYGLVFVALVVLLGMFVYSAPASQAISDATTNLGHAYQGMGMWASPSRILGHAVFVSVRAFQLTRLVPAYLIS